MITTNEESLEYKTLDEYKDLQDIGYVLRVRKEEEEYTTRDLIIKYFKELRILKEGKNESVISIKELHEIFDFSFKKVEGGLFKSNIQIKRQEIFLVLARKLGTIYKIKNDNKASPRVKVTSSTSEIIRGTSSIQNIYPAYYTMYVEQFLKENPIEKWHLDKNEEEGIEYNLTDIESGEDVTTANCAYCECTIKIKSIRSHIKSLKHINNKESI
jgi:hypothetical protein